MATAGLATHTHISTHGGPNKRTQMQWQIKRLLARWRYLLGSYKQVRTHTMVKGNAVEHKEPVRRTNHERRGPKSSGRDNTTCEGGTTRAKQS